MTQPAKGSLNPPKPSLKIAGRTERRSAAPRRRLTVAGAKKVLNGGLLNPELFPSFFQEPQALPDRGETEES